ncbi:hypothetical protein K2173_023267 [Erythroxylum novogranatense]|uniref:Uncharacterized protein n=1 Tax=Erythroxylum novogranatense TaxID=1862640 RepID=A0AAV8T8D9_9ROSI|nr:hypothetical protein K2173_023267 [Erythroxylum novogranatense]
MEMSVTYEGSVKPFPPVDSLPPFQLSLLDLLAPTTYTPFMFFYPMDHLKRVKGDQISSHLKVSLSKTLNLFYPLSGRIRDDLLTIGHYNEGATYIETRVKGNLAAYLKKTDMKSLNQFIPCTPYCQQQDLTVPQVLVQLNIFECGGIVLGVCLLHKIIDGSTASAFFKSWAAIASGSPEKIAHPNFSDASSNFPAPSLPATFFSSIESAYFTEGKCVRRRYVFDASTVSALQEKAKSKLAGNPTRFQALCAFIWKHGMKACRSISDSRKLSAAMPMVNIRSRLDPCLDKHSLGNLFRFPTTNLTPTDIEAELCDLAALIRDAIANVNAENLKGSCGVERSAAIMEQLSQQVDFYEKSPHLFAFSSWYTFGFDDVDFGWGKPVWVGVSGEISGGNRTLDGVILKATGKNNSLEAWIMLDEKIMSILEKDPEFLALASLNPNLFTD